MFVVRDLLLEKQNDEATESTARRMPNLVMATNELVRYSINSCV